MHIFDDTKLDYSDVLLVPGNSNIKSRSDVVLTNKHGLIPIVAANMDGVGTFEMVKVLSEYNLKTALIKHYSEDELVEFFMLEKYTPYAMYSMGANEKDLEKFKNFYRRTIDFELPSVCIDVANGYTENFLRFCESFKKNFPHVITVGNVVTQKRVQELNNVGVDFIKVGIGPGSVCTTRKMTGVGYPQFSAVAECAMVATNIVADGGCHNPGDVVKAFGAGACAVMLGGYFAGHDEGGGEPVTETGSPWNVNLDNAGYRQYRAFYGMASKEAQHKHHGVLLNYRASEGKEVLVPYKGPVENTVKELLGGLRGACSLVGVDKLEDLYDAAQFVIVNRQLNTVFGE